MYDKDHINEHKFFNVMIAILTIIAMLGGLLVKNMMEDIDYLKDRTTRLEQEVIDMKYYQY